MPSYTLEVDLNPISVEQAVSDATEKFTHELKLAGDAVDVSVSLGTISNPVIIAVECPDGCTFKLGSGGTDAIGAGPVAVVSNASGLAVTEILISNPGPSEVDVVVIAAE